MSQAPSILLIDDNMQVRMLARDLLREEFPDSQIRMVDSLDSLRQALEAGGFDIAITDYQLGWTDGLAVLREVKSRYPDCPVVMFTGTGSEEIAVEAMKAGLDDYVLKSSSEHVARLSASVRGVLARAEERRTARETEARYRSLINDVLDTSAVGLFILDASFKVVWINEAIERDFGLRRADVIGQDKRRLVQERIKALFDQPDEFAARVLQSYERNSCALCFECHMPAADGYEERWLEHRSLPIRTGLYAGGRIEHYYDITERKRAAEELRLAKERFQALVETVGDWIWEIDRNGRYTYVSPRIHDLLGYEPADVIGKTPFELMPPEEAERVAPIFEAARSARAPFTGFENTNLHKDGRRIVLETSGRPVFDGHGEFLGYRGMDRDITDRKQSEEAQRRLQRFLDSVVENLPAMIFVKDARDLRFVLFNKAGEELTGHSREELIGKTDYDFFTKEQADFFTTMDREVLAKGQCVDIPEEPLQAGDKGQRILHTKKIPILDEQGTPRYLLGLSEDITEWKRLRQAEEQSRALLQSFVEHTPAAVAMLDKNLRYLAVSQRWLQDYRLGDRNIIGMHHYDVFPEIRQMPGWQEIHRRCLAGAIERRAEDPFPRADGRLDWLRWEVRPWQDESWQIGGIMVLSEIITERKQAEAQVRMVTSALEAAANGVVITDTEGAIQWVNPAFTKMTGYEAAEAIGQNPRLLKSGRQDQPFYERLWSTIKAGGVWHGRLVNKRKDGSLYTEEMTIAPIRDGQGAVSRFVAIKQDITEREAMQRQAHRMEQLALLGQLAGGIAHEIKNPLFVVSGYVQLIKDKLAAGEYARLPVDLDQIEEATKRMGRTVQRFLTLARPSSPAMTVQPCLVQELLRQTLDFLTHELLTHQITLETDISPRLPVIQGEPRLLQDAFLNLLMNAIQAMHGAHGRGRLLVTAMLDPAPAPFQAQPGHATAPSEHDACIEIRVEDDGPGIPPEHRAKLFEPFFSTKPAGRGTGLGLWTVRSNVATMGGTVSCDTELGQGTTFIVRLPIRGDRSLDVSVASADRKRSSTQEPLP